MTIPLIDPILPTAPSRQRPGTFSDEADTFLATLESTFQGDQNAMATQMNIVAAEVDADAVAAAASAQTAVDAALAANGSANYVGIYSTLTGALNIPATVYHLGEFWTLLSNLADVTAKVPGTDPEWTESTPALLDLKVGTLTAGQTVIVNDAGTDFEAVDLSTAINSITPAMFFSMGV